jgi:hypothetical protein
VKSIVGGVDGWRPLNAQDAVLNSVAAWLDRVRAVVAAGRAPTAVSDVAAEIKSLYFKPTSLFSHAPPIWQQVNAKVCADGSLSTTLGNGDSYDTIGEQSYMPDFWLYLDNNAVDGHGQPVSGPVQHGDFVQFSNAANPVHGEPWGQCDFFQRGRGGNPWGLVLIDAPDTRPTSVSYCNAGGVAWDMEFTP